MIGRLNTYCQRARCLVVRKGFLLEEKDVRLGLVHFVVLPS